MKTILQFFKEFEKDIQFYNHNTEIFFAWTFAFGSIVFVFLNTIDRGIFIFLAGIFLSVVLLAAVCFATIYYLYHVSISPSTSLLSRIHKILNTSIVVREYVYGLFYRGKNLIVRACHAKFHLRSISRTT